MSEPRRILSAFDYTDVDLLPGRWRDRVDHARNYYLAIPDDDILHGWRRAAGLPAPGRPLGGWCAENSDQVFGQWLSGMARLYRSTGDDALRDKASLLVREWERTIGDDGDTGMRLYAYDKLLCGLVDLKLYAGMDTVPLIDRTLGHVMATWSRDRIPARPDLINGEPSEWYTFPENLYRAYELTGDERHRSFAESYHYDDYWNRFLDSPSPSDVHHKHAYSHVNTLSSVAKAYEVSGDERYLMIARNAFDYLQTTQCYATGGYGPMERLVPPDGTLGRSIEARANTFEAVCGTWAGFKLARYLTELTGEPRYGDWAERLFYNGVGSALPITDDGKHFYYADYRLAGGVKVYKVSRYSCCSGTYIQNAADYRNLIYFHDASSLAVSLYVPSEVTWSVGEDTVTVRQETAYPEEETVRFTVFTRRATRIALKLRVPGWSSGMEISVNERPADVRTASERWAEIDRAWNNGDTVTARIPLPARMEPIDRQHPRRVAVVRGPVVLALDDWWMDPVPRLPEPQEAARRIVPDVAPGVMRIVDPDGSSPNPKFRPYYSIVEAAAYRIYHDLDDLPIPVW